MDYILSSAVLLSLDAVYLSTTKNFYGNLVGKILSKLEDSGLIIKAQKKLLLSKKQAE